MSSLTQERLKQLLDYDPVSGLFTSRVARGNLTVGVQVSSENGGGYKRVKIDGERHMLHNLAWLYMIGAMPLNLIDHQDGDPSNNKWYNLREATPQQNMYNKKLYKNNTTGIKGVGLTRSGTYMVRVAQKSYGCWQDLELAEFIAKEVRESLHGEFARHE